MPPFKIETSELEVRSVLMRLYHSYWQGEDFYPARFVNGCAPAMEASGWIEKRGDGWRITECGIDQWAEMNRHALLLEPNQRSFLQGKQFFFLRDRLTREGRSDVKTTCVVEGCEKQRMVTSKGGKLTMCEDHQREYWRKEAAKKQAAKKASQQVAAPQTTIDKGFGKVVEVVEPERQYEIAVNPVQHDCDQCEAKRVIEALKAKSPKLAALIDAMEAQERAAMELGL